MDRRGFLTTVGTATTIGLAGCAQAPDGGDEETTTEVTTTTAVETTAEGTTTGGTDGGGGATSIDMVTEGSEYYFDPIGLFVEQGTTVEWVNVSGAHSSTAYHESLSSASVTRIPEEAEPWNSEILSGEGATFEHTFETTGTYDYFCIPHKALGMIARLVVGEPGGPAEGSMPPDADVPESQAIVEQGSVSYSEFTG